jgi:beta-glucanase (GH16 family)
MNLFLLLIGLLLFLGNSYVVMAQPPKPKPKPVAASVGSALPIGVPVARAAPAVRRLIWSDEFEKGNIPDTAKWSYDKGGSGFGNNELQYYHANRPENARVEAGNLVIEAHKEAFENRQYTSARLITQGKVELKRGRIEVRAKLPVGRGTWPAIWMLNARLDMQWPNDGEIDIMEHVGFDPGVIHGTVHTEAYNHVKKTEKGGTITVPDVGTTFHTYAIDWTADRIEFYVDTEKYYTFDRRINGSDHAEWPFTEPFYLILNVAVGGNWGGQKGIDETVFPQRMEVDYVRVYQ